MASTIAINRMKLVFHSIGLSCLGGAIFLQVLVFSGILQRGYFRAIEANTTILNAEICLTAFTAAYFIYVYQREIRSFLKH
jgi:hypothetical protein